MHYCKKNFKCSISANLQKEIDYSYLLGNYCNGLPVIRAIGDAQWGTRL